MDNTESPNNKTGLIINDEARGRVILRNTPFLQSIMDLALSEIKRLTKALQGNCYYYGESGKLEAFDKEEDFQETRLIASFCTERRMALNAAPGNLLEVEDDSIRELPFELTEPVICVYLGLQGGDFGAMILRGTQTAPCFYDEDFSLLKTFATTFSILLKDCRIDPENDEIILSFRSSLMLLMENVNLIQKIKLSDQTLMTVLEVSNLINSSRELREMIDTVLESTKSVIRAEKASIFLKDEETGELVFYIVAGHEGEFLEGMRIPEGQGIVGVCAKEKKSIMVNDAQNDPRLFKKVDEVAHAVTRNLMAAPLVVNDVTIGVMEVLNTIGRPSFTERDIQVFESFSDSVAIALQRRRIQDILESTNVRLEQTNREREQRLNEITCLHAISGALVEANTIEDIFSPVLNIIRDHLKVGRASILLHDPETGSLNIVAGVGGGIPISQNEQWSDSGSRTGLAGFVFKSREPHFIENVNEEPYIRYARPDRYGTDSCILIPMLGGNQDEPFGILCATESDSGIFSESDFRLLATITSQVVRGYENLRLNEEIILKKAMEKEVEITSKIQKNILPAKIPEHKHLELAAISVMAKETGGDFYDYHVHEQDKEITMLVADVSGKSLPAALFMAISSSVLRTIIRTETDPTRILEMANDLIYEESESGMFVTVFLSRYEPMTGLLRYASAGHNEMLIVHPDGTHQQLSSKGVPLGILANQKGKYKGGEIPIKEDDLLVLYTDGVIEAINAENEEFGMDNFLNLLIANKSEPPEVIVDRVHRTVTEFAGQELQYDDFTLLITRFRDIQEGVKTYRISLPAEVNSIPILRDSMMHICRRHGIKGYQLEDLLLVSDEAATNIVLHAYHDAQHPNPSFDCDLEIETGKFVRVTFSDMGKPFSPEEVREPDLQANLTGERKGGFGVYLIRKLMNIVEYSRNGDKNYLFAEKRLD